MRRTLLLLLASLAILRPAMAGPANLAAPKPVSGPIAALRVRYLDGLFRAKPHLASYMGDHRFDGLVQDVSEQAVHQREAELLAQRKVLSALNRASLSLDDRIDADILEDGISLELLDLREIRNWTWNPRLHDPFPYYDPRELVASRLSDLIHGTFGTEAQRRKSVTAQLEALPRFLKQMKAALKQPSKIHLEQATQDNKGRIAFFETDVKAFTQSDSAGERARQRAVSALRDYQTFLEKDLPSKATRDWKLGAELYARKFPLALQTTLSPQEVSKRAEQSFRSSREALYQVALRLHAELWPQQKIEASQEPSAQARIIARVRDEVAKDHPQPSTLVQAHAAKLEALRAFIEQKDLLALPPPETLSVEPMPEFKRGGAGAEYLSPGLLDTTAVWTGTYYVEPVDASWPQEKTDSYLRANNDYAVELTAAHEAYPGHHVQAWYSRKALNPLRATLWNGPFAEGWAVYGEDLLVGLGYGGERNDRYRFNALKGSMIVAANALLDVKLQTGQMTDQQALDFMIKEGFQEQTQAEKKLRRAQLDSTQLVQYFLGRSEIGDLEADVKQREGKDFNQRRFDEALIGHGTIAVKFLRAYLLPAPK